MKLVAKVIFFPEFSKKESKKMKEPYTCNKKMLSLHEIDKA